MAKKQKSVAEEVLAADAATEKKPEPWGKRGRKYVPKHAGPESAESTPAAPPKPKAAKKTRAELQKFSTDGDLVDIWERRMLNPGHTESPTIHIKTPGMRLRWINLSSRGRFQRARYEQGWVPVQKSELQDEREIYGVSYTVEGYVCRGEKQQEMLMKIPVAVYRKIQERRAQINTESYKKLRQNMGSAGYQHFKQKYGGSAGDQAEEAANNFVGSIKFGNEKVSSDELFE